MNRIEILAGQIHELGRPAIPTIALPDLVNPIDPHPVERLPKFLFLLSPGPGADPGGRRHPDREPSILDPRRGPIIAA